MYTLTDTDDLEIEMRATTDQPTLVNVAHHSYFNLAGHASGPITEQQLQLFAAEYTPATAQIPTGQRAPVQGTPLISLGRRPSVENLAAAGGAPVGFDHNWVVDGDAHQLRKVARLSDPKSGRVLTLEANQPGVQFYSGNYLGRQANGQGRGGVSAVRWAVPGDAEVPQLDQRASLAGRSDLVAGADVPAPDALSLFGGMTHTQGRAWPSTDSRS